MGLHHGHSHGHDHGHSHASGEATRRALTWALILNGGFLGIEAAIGFISGSLALLSDAAHMVSDVAALALALWASRLASKPPSASRTYGYRRAEVLGGFVNGLALLVACGLITHSAINRLWHGGHDVNGLPVLIAGAIGLLINLGSAWHLHRASDHSNLNVRGALLHMLADALGSLGAMVAAVLVMRGVTAADAVISLLIVVLVLWSTWSLMRDAAAVLLQFSPAGAPAEEVRGALHQVEGVCGIHDLHVWSLDGRETVLSAHVVCEDLGRERELRAAIGQVLHERFAITHCTLQLEDNGDACAPNCSLFPEHS